MTMTAEQSRQTGGYYAQQWTVRDEYAAAAMAGRGKCPLAVWLRRLADHLTWTLAIRSRCKLPKSQGMGDGIRSWLPTSPKCDAGGTNAGGALVRSWLPTSPEC